MSSFQHFAAPPQVKDRLKWWTDGQEKLLRQVRNSSQELIYLSDTPHPQRDIPACLSENSISECNTSEPSENIAISGFKSMDPTPWLCSNVCPAVKDGVVAYRDASHISVDMSIALIPKLEQALRDQGVNL